MYTALGTEVTFIEVGTKPLVKRQPVLIGRSLPSPSGHLEPAHAQSVGPPRVSSGAHKPRAAKQQTSAHPRHPAHAFTPSACGLRTTSFLTLLRISLPLRIYTPGRGQPDARLRPRDRPRGAAHPHPGPPHRLPHRRHRHQGHPRGARYVAVQQSYSNRSSARSQCLEGQARLAPYFVKKDHLSIFGRANAMTSLASLVRLKIGSMAAGKKCHQ